MNSSEFDANVSHTLEEINERLITKGQEYVPDASISRFHNFELGAILQNETPIVSLRGYMTKHVVSLYDMLNSDDAKDFSREKWDEKILDTMTYLAILRAMVYYRHDMPEGVNLTDFTEGVDLTDFTYFTESNEKENNA